MWVQTQEIPSYRKDVAVFFMPTAKTKQEWSRASVELRDAYTYFMLSRQAMNCTPSTLAFYRYTAWKFLEWIEYRGHTSPEEVTARYVREYIAELVSKGKKDTTVWDHTRAKAERTGARLSVQYSFNDSTLYLLLPLEVMLEME